MYILKDWRLSVFKIDKAASKNVNDGEHGHSENEKLEAFERVILLLS